MAQRKLAEAAGRSARVLERLSSGLRINHAADDAAGLSISEKLRVDSRVYTQAVRNVNDSLSVTAIAQSALHELGNITARQLELSEQAANGAYSAVQRSALDNEARALTQEYNRILGVTDFNGQQLFGHNWDNLVIQAGAGEEGTIGFKLGDEMAAKISPGSYFLLNDGVYQNCFYFTVDGQGSAPALNGSYLYRPVALFSNEEHEVTDFTLPDPAGVEGRECALGTVNGTLYYVWFDRGAGADPGWGDHGIRVDASGLSQAAELAAATADAIRADGAPFQAESLGGASIRLTASNPGAVGNAYDEDSGTIVSIRQQGADQIITAEQIAHKVSSTLSSYGISNYLADDDTIRVTNTRSGNYPDSSSGTSNVWIEDVVGGTGLAAYSLSGSPEQLSLVDLNGDGLVDLAATNYNGIGVRFGLGDGSFGLLTSYATGTYCRRVETADLNQDGHPDLIASNWLSGSVTILFNNGSGAFTSFANYTTSGGQFDVATGDVDGDGDLDLATTTNNSSYALQIYKNRGDGSFDAPISYAIPGLGSRALVAADFTGDGKLDLASAGNVTSLIIWAGNGDGTFSPVHTYTASALSWYMDTADFDGDGDGDLVLGGGGGGSFSVFMNDGQGSFSTVATYLPAGSESFGVVTGDFNGDGRPDIATTDRGQGRMSVYLNSGTGTFGSPLSFAMGAGADGIAAGDLNGDGRLDLVTGDKTAHSASVRLNNGDGTFNDPRGDQREITYLSFGDARGRLDVAHVDLTSQRGALAALDTLQERLLKIHNELGVLGASESRLKTAINTLGAARENFDAAAGRMTDADVAAETADLTRQKILEQLGAMVLAQANLAPQLALSLLRMPRQ